MNYCNYLKKEKCTCFDDIKVFYLVVNSKRNLSIIKKKSLKNHQEKAGKSFAYP